MSRPYVLLAYEDRYHEGLDKLLRKFRARISPSAQLALEPTPVDGTGGFVSDIAMLARVGIPRRGQPTYVIAVADADRPANLVPGWSSRLGSARDLARLRREWRKVLRGRAGAHAHRVGVAIIRWSQESVMLAAPEVLLGLSAANRPQVEKLLEACVPDPRSASPEHFVDTYREPQRCMERVTRAAYDERFNKARHGVDVMKRINDTDALIDPLMQRCPDIRRLARGLVLLERLSVVAAQPPAAP